jgi:predicted NAD/FAD-dependent oxidoreductase
MLVPKADLSALLPDLAAQYVLRHGGAVHAGAKATALLPQADGGWRVQASGAALGAGWEQRFDSVVLAPGALHSAALLDGLGNGPGAGLAARLRAFAYEAITTVYLQYDAALTLDLPFIALIDHPQQGHWGQFVFDRGQLDARNAGLLAVVISASSDAAALGQETLTAAVAGQLAQVLRRPELAQPRWARIITEKRATFACAPALDRPGVATGLPGLFLAGDYTAGDYPATLEGAVRSGTAAAQELLKIKK